MVKMFHNWNNGILNHVVYIRVTHIVLPTFDLSDNVRQQMIDITNKINYSFRNSWINQYTICNKR